jgi:hypothetical protein
MRNLLVGLIVSSLFFVSQRSVWANSSVIQIETLASAIYLAEGGDKTRHPYGILKHYKVTTPRQACINTIKSNLRRFRSQFVETDFIHFMSLSYCPIGADNDKAYRVNQFWERNVKFFYSKYKTHNQVGGSHG